MAGRATPAQIAALIVSLRIKGETVEEMTGLVEAMRAAAVAVDVGLPVVDTAGTGGDRSGTFNISTAAALVTAGAGVTVAKHGNRSASSRCGSADVLEGLGMVIDLPPEATVQLIRETGFGYLHAPLYHPAMRHAGPVRRELGIPTVFNFLGPLANPAGARRQALGVADAEMAERMVGALQLLGSEYAFVFYGEDGLDELTTTGTSFIYRLKDGEITHAEFTPEDFRVARAELADLAGGDVEENVRIIREVLAGRGERLVMSSWSMPPQLWWHRGRRSGSRKRCASGRMPSMAGPQRACWRGSSTGAASWPESPIPVNPGLGSTQGVAGNPGLVYVPQDPRALVAGALH